ncbi:MAG: hypothetical protein EBR79_02335 [Proteobacteria bacterium]|nr:hypothetical protein [Pseudomonadota bacterium]
MSKAKAAEVFGIDPKTIYNWEQRADLTPCLAKTRKRKLVRACLTMRGGGYATPPVFYAAMSLRSPFRK